MYLPHGKNTMDSFLFFRVPSPMSLTSLIVQTQCGIFFFLAIMSNPRSCLILNDTVHRSDFTDVPSVYCHDFCRLMLG